MPALRPALSGALISRLEALADDLDNGVFKPSTVAAINNALRNQPCARFVEVDRQVREFARLYHYRRTPRRRFSFWRLLEAAALARPTTDGALLRRHAELAPIFVSHADGRVREASLDRLQALDGPYLICALALRLNDWAGPVRYAAIECADRLLPTTPAVMIAEAGWEILQRRSSWARGGDGMLILDHAFDRPDVLEALVDLVTSRSTGAGMRVLAQLGRSPGIDIHLPKIAREAIQPGIRSMAYRFIINGAAEWPSGYELVSADKAYGEKRRRRNYARRPLTQPFGAADFIVEASRDRSATVRAVAADALVRGRHDLPNAVEMARTFAGDKSPGIRQRAEFVLTDLRA